MFCANIILGVYMESIYNIKNKKLEDYFVSIGEKKYKAKQLFDWIYVKRINNFDNISNIKKDVIERLKKDFYFDKIDIIQKQIDIDVKKYLLKLSDSKTIEAVLMEHDYGTSLCISSQVGCNMNCSFCESGRIKKQRDLIYNEANKINNVLNDQEFLNNPNEVLKMQILENQKQDEKNRKIREEFNQKYNLFNIK